MTGAAAGAEADLLDVARAAARAAAAELLVRYEAAPVGVTAKSTATDLVSEADLAAERAIRALLAERRPGDAILGEEGGETAATGESGVRWVVDPLDGTVNYLFGYPQWSVSVACEDASGETLAGVVLDPLRDEEFAATRSGPALLNGEALRRSAPAGDVPDAPATGGSGAHGAADVSLATALIATGFAYDAAVRERQATIAAGLLPRVRDIRRGGSAALDLVWTACGRCDAYYERGVKQWDIAAGALVCARAGLELHELPAREGEPWGLLAAPPALARPLLALVLGT